MNRNAAAFKLAHRVARRSVAGYGGDYRATFAETLRDIFAQIAADAAGCVAVFLDEATTEEDFLDIDYEFYCCALWALEGSPHCDALAA